MEDKEIVDLFWLRKDQAIVETQMKYGKLCLQIAKNMIGNLQDAEEIVNETYLGVWNSIPPERPKHLKSFVCRIARNISIDRIRYYNADKRKNEGIVTLNEVEDILSGTDTPENIFDRKEIAAMISEYLRQEKEIKRNMFIKRYWYYESISEIAQEYGVSESKVKVTLHRIRQGLKKYLESKEVTL